MRLQNKLILAPQLIKARFVERPNRYLAIVCIDGNNVEAFVPNPGRMNELLFKDILALVRKVDKPKRKTSYDLVAVYYNDIWVCIDSQMPNKSVYHFLTHKKLEEFVDYPDIYKEKNYLTSRFDFFLDGKANSKGCFIEAKSCTLVENKVALFPDAPTIRGTKHLHHLIEARKEGYEAYAIIVIQREDAVLFMPNRKTDPEFAEAMKLASKKDVKVMAISTRLQGNEILFHKRIQVQLD